MYYFLYLCRKNRQKFGIMDANAIIKGEIVDGKKALRREIRQLKKACPYGEKLRKSVSVWEKVEQLPAFQQADIVLAYWSMEDEVYTHDFVKERLQPGEGYAIPEPVGELFTDWGKIDLILVPGVAFDKSGNRLGRGKGYYDKVLKQTGAYKLGVCFDFQLVERVPVEPHDVKMDRVVASGE